MHIKVEDAGEDEGGRKDRLRWALALLRLQDSAGLGRLGSRPAPESHARTPGYLTLGTTLMRMEHCWKNLPETLGTSSLR